MALNSLNNIKNWFKTNLVPSQEQWWDVFDSFRHKSDKVAATDIDGLDNLLSAKASADVLTSHTTAGNAHTALFGQKVDKVTGKVLSDQNYSLPEKEKLAGIEAWVNTQIAAVTVGSTPLGSITPATTIPATINVHGFAAAAGTYANCGGMVVPANSIAFLSRVAGAWTVSATTFSLTEYQKIVDGNKINTWTAKSYLSGDQVNYLGKDWVSNAATIAGDIPGTSSKWVERLNLFPEKVNKNLSEFILADELGRVIIKIDAAGFNSKKYNICDAAGNVVGSFDTSTLSDIVLLKQLLPLFNTDSRYLKEFYITDENNKVAMKYTSDGFDVAKLSPHFQSLITAQAATSSFIPVGNFIDDINLNIIYGQSLSIGGNTINAENFYTSKAFANGVLIVPPADSDINSKTYNDTYFGNIVDMAVTGSGLNGRMICKKWNELLIAEDKVNLNTFNFNLMGMVAGISGGEWYQLNKQNIAIDGTGWATLTSFGANNVGRAYCHLLHGVYFAREKAHAQGKSLNVNTLSWVQGEAASDNQDTVTQYYDKLVAIFTDLNNDIKTVTGQTNDIEFIIYQNSSFSIYQVPTSPNYVAGRYTEGVPLACLKAAIDLPNVSFATPLYPFSQSQATSDKIHLSDKGHAMMASHFGITAKRIVTDKKTLKPLYPNSISVFNDGTNYYTKVQFDVVQKPLVFDITGDDGNNMLGHGAQPNYGFSIKTAGGVEIITNVRLSTDDTVVIKTSQNPAGLSLTYAWTGVYGGGNLRDSQGDSITTTFNSTTYRCDNWCPFFRITI